jgi:hypothetical protein
MNKLGTQIKMKLRSFEKLKDKIYLRVLFLILKSIRSRFKNDTLLKNTLNVYSALEMTAEKKALEAKNEVIYSLSKKKVSDLHLPQKKGHHLVFYGKKVSMIYAFKLNV